MKALNLEIEFGGSSEDSLEVMNLDERDERDGMRGEMKMRDMRDRNKEMRDLNTYYSKKEIIKKKIIHLNPISDLITMRMDLHIST
jgi:hypothetical protein